MRNSRTRAYLALAILAVLWGYNWVVMKIAVQYAPPIEFAALRLLLGAGVLFIALAVLRKPLRPARPWQYFWIGMFLSGGFLALATWAVLISGAGKVAILSYTMPLWVALAGWPLLGERLNAVQIAALGIALAGIILVLDIRDTHGSLFADMLALLAGVSWAIGVIMSKRVQRAGTVDVLELTTWQMFFGGALVGIAALIVPEHATHWTWAYGGALAYNAIGASALAFFLWIYALQHLPARDASMGTLANPVIGIIAAWLQLGEKPSTSEAIGMGLVVIALGALALQQQGVTDDK
ncbi:MAG TPA: EamA family transporter [Candidatus Baltobacteraceae bacterium]|nr:EamA family transporter [Candidatus Baltobacteraceae bacterium]